MNYQYRMEKYSWKYSPGHNSWLSCEGQGLVWRDFQRNLWLMWKYLSKNFPLFCDNSCIRQLCGIVWIDGPNMLHFIFKIINKATRGGVSNLKDDTEKATLYNFGTNVKDILVFKIHNHHWKGWTQWKLCPSLFYRSFIRAQIRLELIFHTHYNLVRYR